MCVYQGLDEEGLTSQLLFSPSLAHNIIIINIIKPNLLSFVHPSIHT